MAVPGAKQAGERSLDVLVQTASEQAVGVAREQLDVARRELLARARQAGPGAALVGGGALLAAFASGTATAGLVLLFSRRPRAAAAALGVTGAYAGAGAFMARDGLARLRELGASPAPPVEEPGSTKPSRPAAAKAAGRAKAAAKSPKKAAGRTKAAAKSPSRAAGRTKAAAESPTQPARGTKAKPTKTSARRPPAKREQAS